MDDKQKIFAKGFIAAVVVKKRPNLSKAYLALAAAAFYGIRAAREFEKEIEEQVNETIIQQ